MKRLKILLWGLTVALELHPSLALMAIERFSGVSPEVICCRFTGLGKPEVNAWLTLRVVILEGRGFYYTRRLHPAQLLKCGEIGYK